MAGQLDLSTWDFNQHKILHLNGEWLFAPYFTDELSLGNKVQVPGSWQATATSSLSSPYGRGTYGLNLRLPKGQSDLAIYIPDEAIAWKAFVNGKLRMENGVPGTDYASTRVKRRSVVIPLSDAAERESTELRIQIANYHYDVGGLINTPLIGKQTVLEQRRDAVPIMDGFLIGALLLGAIYHLFLYLIRKEDRASLLFALSSFLIAIRAAAVAHFFEQFISIPSIFDISVRLEYLSQFIFVPVYVSFVSNLFPQKKHGFAVAFYASTALILSIVVLVLPPPRFMVLATKPFQLIILSALLYVLYMFIRAFYQGHRGALSALIGFGIFFALVVNDILHANLIIRTAHLAPFGLLVFTLSQSFIISLRFSQSFAREKALVLDLANEKAELDKRIEARTAELKASNEALRAMDMSKTRVLAILAHELRTPITLILAPLEQLRKGRYGNTLSKDSEVFSNLERNGNRLLQHVESLFQFARIELGKFNLKRRPLDIGETLKFYTAEIIPLAERKGLRLDFSENLDGCRCIEADESLFEIAFFNLLTNAIKFTPKGGHVHVSVEALHEGIPNSSFAVHVADTGEGISIDKLPKIFDKLYRADDSETQLFDGAGIGLSLTKKIVELHGGRISAQSTLGEGSTFTLYLPVCPDEVEGSCQMETLERWELINDDADTATDDENIPRNTRKPRVLLVEDNQELRDS
ncbi:ATP-binding protein [Treponema sp.]